ncbi:ABC transporter permease [Paenibacillus prosopidis]|uniref:Putative aldouronate transport system permease protein n=1 Tax=Paenibacillus prosopidis TaxID=630520 RepID=A0A368VSV1_9BACL|nr:ABC transporter permease subunit [Paenibacillus prosopidis]RCW43056.1 putative aldouronate transport system permease protein [Paenibacillus prosopidis]
MQTEPVVHPRNNRKLWTRLLSQKELQLMVLPGIVFLIIFKFVPIYGMQLAFKELSVSKGIWQSPWVGFQHFIDFFESPLFANVMYNTIMISFLKIVLLTPLPIIFALLMNEIRSGRLKTVFQGISYLPHFLSWVIVGGLILTVLGKDDGTLNQILMMMGFIQEPVFFMGTGEYFWPILLITENWKEMGWGAIIYLAAIAGIDPEIYEASKIDGAGRFKQIIHITLPSIMTTIIILLILRVGYVLDAGFDQILVLRNPIIQDVSNIIDIHVLETGLQEGRYGYATAIGMFKSVIGFAMVWGCNKIARKFNMGIW